MSPRIFVQGKKYMRKTQQKLIRSDGLVRPNGKLFGKSLFKAVQEIFAKLALGNKGLQVPHTQDTRRSTLLAPSQIKSLANCPDLMARCVAILTNRTTESIL